jgi:hypothetical protein
MVAYSEPRNRRFGCLEYLGNDGYMIGILPFNRSKNDHYLLGAIESCLLHEKNVAFWEILTRVE